MRRIRSAALRALILTTSIFVLAAAGASSREALAHGGNPAVAFLTTPTCTATVAQGSCYLIRWLDSDIPIITGTASVQLFATTHSPITFPAGTIPSDLESRSMEIVSGIHEADRTNAWCWDTTGVAPGVYYIWSRMNEPAIEMSLSIISWAPGTLTVVAPGEEPAMSVFFENPNSPFKFADLDFPVRLCGRDSPTDPGGKVTIEVTPNRNTEENLELIATDLPINGAFSWNTRCKVEGDWALKATLTTPGGEKFVNWSRFFLLITHPFAPRDAGGLNEGCLGGDGGVEDGSESDAGDEADAGVVDATATKLPAEGCGCTTSSAPRGDYAALMAIAAIAWLRSRRGCVR